MLLVGAVLLYAPTPPANSSRRCTLMCHHRHRDTAGRGGAPGCTLNRPAVRVPTATGAACLNHRAPQRGTTTGNHRAPRGTHRATQGTMGHHRAKRGTTVFLKYLQNELLDQYDISAHWEGCGVLVWTILRPRVDSFTTSGSV